MPPAQPKPKPQSTDHVVIIGAGFGGIAAAIELLGHGFDRITLIEAGSGIGGTWHFNTYPGAACDVPSHLYSYSFEQRAVWPSFCSPQSTILDYLREVAEKYDVTSRVRTETRVTACHWDDETKRWSLDLLAGDGTTGSLDADVLIVATGQLNQPAYPGIPGLDSFAGEAFHSARWNHDYDLSGKRVAVIGTGASAVQFVPAIVDQVARLSVFQRTGNWFLPRQNKPYRAPVRALFRAVPATHRAFRAALMVYLEFLTASIRHPRTLGRVVGLWSRLFMRRQLRDRKLRETVWPRYTFGCKRVLFSSHFLPALQRPQTELVTEAITEMTPAGPRTGDGRVHEVDCVIYGTGFRPADFMFPMQITGSDGRALVDEWDEGGASAHLGMTVPGFPSMFLMYGPNTNTSGGSIIFFLEQQAGYIRQALELRSRRHARALDVRRTVAQESDRALQASFAGTAWTDCDSWYQDAGGRNIANWPGYMRDYAEATKAPRPADFTFLR